MCGIKPFLLQPCLFKAFLNRVDPEYAAPAGTKYSMSTIYTCLGLLCLQKISYIK
jgi:hypothetical protein